MIRSTRSLLLSLVALFALTGCIGDPATDGSAALETEETIPYDVWTLATAGCEDADPSSAVLASVEGAPSLVALLARDGHVICVDALEVILREIDVRAVDPANDDPSPQPSDPADADPFGADPFGTPSILPTSGSAPGSGGSPHAKSDGASRASGDSDPDQDPTPTPMFGQIDQDPTPTPMYPDGLDRDPTPTPMFGGGEDPTPTPMYGGNN